MLGVFESLQIDVMKISDGALREGLIYDMMGRIEHEDVREHTVYALCDRYHVNMQHAIRVEKTALQLLDQVADAWGLDDEEHMYMLAWSARLHEMGLDIAHSQYHRHGAYVVENSDMPGFSRELQKYLAILIGGHRRKFPAGAIAELPEETQKIISRLCVLLRLSVKLHHSRSVVPLPEIKLKANNDGLKITFPPKWMDEHPLTAADIEREKKYLATANISLDIG
jgi:exopolyphosphatase/guanosine-5'-triphosphate,3'-diphosphate pyrophosphatase